MKLLIEIEDRHIDKVIRDLSDSDLCPSFLNLDECNDCRNGCWRCWTNALNTKHEKKDK